MVDAVVAKLLEYLSKTPYACTSLEQLSTRPANYVFRGKLAQPITEEDATTSSTVIVKHTTERVDPRRHVTFPFPSPIPTFPVALTLR